MMQVRLSSKVGWITSFIRLELTILWSLRPALSSFHSFYGSIGSWGDVFLPMPKRLSTLLTTGFGASCCRIYFLSRGTIVGAMKWSLALILLRSHVIISSEMPSLPHKWIDCSPVALVMKSPIILITYAGSPVICKSRWTNIGLYFMKIFRPSKSSSFLGDRGTSVKPWLICALVSFQLWSSKSLL